MRLRSTAALIIAALMMCTLLSVGSTKVMADTKPSVNVEVVGNIEVGQEIQININVNNIDTFFAGAMEFKCDTDVLKILEIQKGSLITKNGIEIFEAVKTIYEDTGKARFEFTCMGKIDGFSGSGAFVVLKAKVLKKQSFAINSIPFKKELDSDNNLKLRLFDKNVEEVNYSFKAFSYAAEQSGGSTNPSGANGTVNNNTNTSNNANGSNNTNASNQAKGNQGTNTQQNTSNNSGTDKNGSNAENNNPSLSKGETKQTLKDNKGTAENKSSSGPYLIYGSAGVMLVLLGTAGYMMYKKRKIE